MQCLDRCQYEFTNITEGEIRNATNNVNRLNNLRYAVLIAVTERKLEKCLQKLLKGEYMEKHQL